jgi:hypothetical protein
LADDQRPLEVKAAANPVYRIARRPDPWTWPEWAYANSTDGTFDNRWDDPEGSYRVLYASSQRAGAFVETLARYRVDLALLAELDQIALDDPADSPIPAGTVPHEWASERRIGKAVLKGDFADVTHPRSLTYLRGFLAAWLVARGITDLDAGTIRTVERPVTQRMSRVIYECTVDGRRAYEGVYYRSRLGDLYENWGVFDTDVSGVTSPLSALDHGDEIHVGDADFAEALTFLDLKLEPTPETVPVAGSAPKR